MVRLPVRRALALTVLAAAAGIGAIPPAGAAGPAAVGWWWVGHPLGSAPALFSPDPAPPSGGLYVASNATGAVGISAIRFRLGPGIRARTLTLQISKTSDMPVIDACPSVGSWEPAEDGGWDQRPEADCSSGAARGVVNGARTEVRFSLAAFDRRDPFDIVLVPGTGADGPPTFSVAFEPPGVDALTTAGGTAPPSSPSVATEGGASARTAGLSESEWAPAAPVVPEGPTALSSLTPPPAAPAERATGAEALPAPSPALVSSAPGVDGGFDYPAVLGLPLVLLLGASYVAWILTRPVIVPSLSSTRRPR